MDLMSVETIQEVNDMDYWTALPFRGNVDRALQLAETSLTAAGLRITVRTATSLTAEGGSMNNTRDSPLLGASRLHLVARSGELAAEVELGGVRRLARFVTLFPPLLCLGLAVIFSVVFFTVFGPGPWMWPVGLLCGLIAAVWLVLGPIMARSFYRRARTGIDTLLANMVACGEAR
jgi:hypothetical protein